MTKKPQQNENKKRAQRFFFIKKIDERKKNK